MNAMYCLNNNSGALNQLQSNIRFLFFNYIHSSDFENKCIDTSPGQVININKVKKSNKQKNYTFHL